MKTRGEKLLDVISRKDTAYLPSQVVFSTEQKRLSVASALGLSIEKLDEYLGNHILFTAQMDDVPSYFTGDEKKLRRAAGAGFAVIDENTHRIKDRWEGEFDMGAPNGFFNYGHPLSGKSPEEIAAYKAPALKNMDEHFALAEEDRAAEKDRLVIVCGYNGIFERAYALTDFEEFMYLLADEPEAAAKLMDAITDYKVEIAKETVKRDFPLAHHGDDLGTQQGPFFSEDMFKRLLLPRLKRLFRVYKDAGVLVQMHSCGNIIKFLPYLIDIGLDVLEPVQPVMDITFLKREYGQYITFFGGIDTQELLPSATPKKVYEETLRTIDILGKNGGYIAGPSQEIMPDVPVENVVAMLEAINECRGQVS